MIPQCQSRQTWAIRHRQILLASSLDQISMHSGVPELTHTYCRPQPVALWHLCHDLNPAIFDALLAFGRDTCGSNRRNDTTERSVRSDCAHRNVRRRTATPAAIPRRKVDRIAVNQLPFGDVGRLGGQRRHNVQALVVDEYILPVGCGPAELSVFESACLCFLSVCV